MNPDDPYSDDYSDLDALDIYAPVIEPDDAALDWPDLASAEESESRPQTLLFSAESPMDRWR